MAQAHPPNETQQPQEHDERHQATEEKQGGGGSTNFEKYHNLTYEASKVVYESGAMWQCLSRNYKQRNEHMT